MYSLLFASVLLLLWIHSATGQNSPLLPFGPSHPDDMTQPLTDDSYVEFDLDVPFLFYGTAQTSARAVSNGFIAFDGTYTDCCGSGFPYGNNKIAALWDDLYPGTLYYRQSTTDATDLNAATSHVRSLYRDMSEFQATWALVVTWDRFSLYSDRSIENTFQVILATDGTNSFAIILYGDVEHATGATVGIDSGDDVNYSEMCISQTDDTLSLESIRQSGQSSAGVLVLRVNTANPDQASYECTPTVPLTPPEASYYCRWSDDTETTIDVNFIIEYSVVGLNAYDTQKYEAGEDAYLDDASCEMYTSTSSRTTTFSFTVDPSAGTPACGVAVTGEEDKALDITIRGWNDDIGFDVENDLIYRFNCPTDTVLPATAELGIEFQGIDVVALNIPDRTVTLQIIAPGHSAPLSVVAIGQMIQLRLIYDNTANNDETYGVYGVTCTVADTAAFDGITADLITDGCVAEQDVGEIWYITRAFQQTSLSVEGLFITDTGMMVVNKFVNKDNLFFRCVIDVCFFASAPVPDLCTNSCPDGRRKRSTSMNDAGANNKVVYSSVRIATPKGIQQTNPSSDSERCGEYFTMETLYIVSGVIGVLVAVAFLVTSVVFYKLLHLQTSKK